MTIISHLCMADQFVCLEAEACHSSNLVTWFIRPELLRKLFSFAQEAIFFKGAAWTLKLHERDLYGQKTEETGRTQCILCLIILVNIVIACTDSLVNLKG